MAPSTERDLLIAARRFDLGALGRIYDQFSPGIFRYAMRLLGDGDLAEDCVAETFSRFLRSLRSGAGPDDHLKAYLYRIAHNWITDSYRRQSPFTQELNDSMKMDDHVLPEKQVEGAQEREKIKRALKALTPDQRQVIVLRYIEGWQNEEIAAAVDKQVGAVKALQHRALESLRRILPREEMNNHERSSEPI